MPEHRIDPALRTLIRGVAQATVELVAEEYDSPAEMWAERTQIAEQIARATMACAEEDAASEVHAVREAADG